MIWHIAMVFKGLSIHIARFHSQSRTGGGGAYSRDKNTCAGTLAETGRGAYTREEVYSQDTTVFCLLIQLGTQWRINLSLVYTAPTTSGYLIFANRLYLNQLSMDGSRVNVLVGGQDDASDVDTHVRNNSLFWIDSRRRMILKSSLDGLKRGVVLDHGLSQPGDSYHRLILCNSILNVLLLSMCR